MRRDLGLLLLLIGAMAAVPALGDAAFSGATVDLQPGGLSARSPVEIALPLARVHGTAVTVEAMGEPIRVTDTRPGEPGWSLVAQADAPVDARGVAMAAPLMVVAQADLLPAGIALGQPGPLDLPRTIAQAAPGAGGGVWQVAPLIRLTVPPGAASGDYTATIQVTIA